MKMWIKNSWGALINIDKFTKIDCWMCSIPAGKHRWVIVGRTANPPLESKTTRKTKTSSEEQAFGIGEWQENTSYEYTWGAMVDNCSTTIDTFANHEEAKIFFNKLVKKLGAEAI